jgi:adenosylhomocysteine nucleosidase
VVGIVCALAAEARHLKPTTRPGAPCATLADGSLLCVSGMGAAAAAAGARALIAAGARALTSFGLAGGLDPALVPGAICLPSEVIGADGTALPTSAAWRLRLASALVGAYPIAEGALLSSARVVASVAEKAALRAATAAVAIDMESLAVAHVAAAHQLPFIAVRVIVDGAADALPDAVAAAGDAEGHLNLWRLLGALARSPTDLPPLIRLGARYRAASRTLKVLARAGEWPQRAFAP